MRTGPDRDGKDEDQNGNGGKDVGKIVLSDKIG